MPASSSTGSGDNGRGKATLKAALSFHPTFRPLRSVQNNSQNAVVTQIIDGKQFGQLSTRRRHATPHIRPKLVLFEIVLTVLRIQEFCFFTSLATFSHRDMIIQQKWQGEHCLLWHRKRSDQAISQQGPANEKHCYVRRLQSDPMGFGLGKSILCTSTQTRSRIPRPRSILIMSTATKNCSTIRYRSGHRSYVPLAQILTSVFERKQPRPPCQGIPKAK